MWWIALPTFTKPTPTTCACPATACLATAFVRPVPAFAKELGFRHEDHGDAFAHLVQEALDAGCLIVAAREADDAPCWPGCLPHVVGVGLDWDVPRGAPRLAGDGANGSVIMATGHPRPIPGVPQRRNLYGISFAVAQVTGWAAANAPTIAAGRPIRQADLLALLQPCAA